MTRKFRRVGWYTAIARYAINGAVWWFQYQSPRPLCERCGASVVRGGPGNRACFPVLAFVDEYAALLNSLSGRGKNDEMWRRARQVLLAQGDPLTLTVAEPKHEIWRLRKTSRP